MWVGCCASCILFVLVYFVLCYYSWVSICCGFAFTFVILVCLFVDCLWFSMLLVVMKLFYLVNWFADLERIVCCWFGSWLLCCLFVELFT